MDVRPVSPRSPQPIKNAQAVASSAPQMARIGADDRPR